MPVLPPIVGHSSACARLTAAGHSREKDSVAAGRLWLVVSRWRRRAQQALLQQRAARLGHVVAARRAWLDLHAWRMAKEARVARRLRADLHRWRALLRVAFHAWRVSLAAQHANLSRRADELVLRATRMCRVCWAGWLRYVSLSVAARRVLVGRALRLLRTCLGGWSTWLEARRLKRPAKVALRRRGRLSRLRLAHHRWAAAANERRMAQALIVLAAAQSRSAALSASVARWRAARAVLLRRAVRTRRAYLFMASRLLGAVMGAWRQLPEARRRLEAAVPRVAARLQLTRLRLQVGRWQLAVASAAGRKHLLAGCDRRARTAALCAALAALRAPALRQCARRRAAVAVAAAGRASALCLHLRGWRIAYTRRSQGREAVAAMARGLRQWRRAAGTSKRRTAAATAASADAALRWRRGWLGWWRALSSARRLERQGLVLARQAGRHADSRRAFGQWRPCARFSAAAAAAAEAARAVLLARVVCDWRAQTAEAEAADGAWRRAVRSRYFRLVGRGFGGWSLLVEWRRALRGRGQAVCAARRRLHRLRAVSVWRSRAAAAASRRALAESFAEARALSIALGAWRAFRSEQHRLAAAARMADASHAEALCARMVGAWMRFAWLRSERRVAKAAERAAHCAALRRAARGRWLQRWRQLYAGGLTRAVVQAGNVRAVGRWRAGRALCRLQSNVLARRVGLGRWRMATCHVSRRRLCRALRGWFGYLSWQSDHRSARRLAESSAGRRLCRMCWAGWERYHVRKRHKAALMASAAASYRREMRTRTVAAWLQSGLAAHTAKVELVAARTALRAAQSLRLADRFARRWLAAVAERRASRDPRGAAGVPAGCRHTPAGRAAGGTATVSPPGPVHDVWHGQFRRGVAGPAYGEQASLAGTVWAPHVLPASGAAAAPLPEPRTSCHRPGLSIPLGGGRHAERGPSSRPQATGGRSCEWESLLPPPTARRAPRPLPQFDATDAVPFHLRFDTASPAAACAAEPAIRTPVVPEPPETLSQLLDWQRVREQLHTPPAPQPDPETILQEGCASSAASQPVHSGVVSPHPIACSVPSSRPAPPVSPPRRVSPAAPRVAPNAPPPAVGSDGDDAPGAEEVREIEAGLRAHAEMKARHAANQRLLDKLVAQADRLPPAQRPPVLEAARQLRVAVAGYLEPARAASRQADVERLAMRVARLGDSEGDGRGGGGRLAGGDAHGGGRGSGGGAGLVVCL